MKLAALLLLPACLALAQVPTPESVLGHKPGDDFYLASYDESLGYFLSSFGLFDSCNSSLRISYQSVSL